MTEAGIRKFIAVVLWVVALTCPAFAAGEVSVAALFPYGGAFAPGSWTPLRVEVSNETDQDIDGSVRLLLLAEGTPEYRSPMYVAKQSRVSRVIWTKVFRSPQAGTTGRVTYNDAGGAVVGRTEVAGSPATLSTQISSNGISDCGYMVSIVGGGLLNDEVMLDGVGDMLGSFYELRTIRTVVDASNAPPAAVPYAGAYCVQIQGVNPDVLSPVQRQAILDYVSSGGTLLISAPEASVVGASWLAPYLPVKLLANREMKQVPSPKAGASLPFAGYFACAEAQRGDGTVLLADSEYVHAAYRKHGLGRVAFTSFPASALNVQDEVAGVLWRNLIGLDRPRVGPGGSALAVEYPRLMEPMLGRQAASWSVAIAVAAGLVVLMLALHLVFRGTARPRAFGFSVMVSVLVAGVFWAMAAMRQEVEPLQQARLSVVDASRDGALCNEYAGLSGPQRALSREVTDSASAVTVALSRQDRPIVSEWPAAIQQIEAQPQQVNLVSLATQLDRGRRASATGRFTAEGLVVSVKNELGLELSSAQLCWDPYRMSVPAIGQGEASFAAGQASLRPADEFTSASGLTSQSEQHRGEILKASLERIASSTKPMPMWPTVIGWTTEWPAVTEPSAVPDRSASQTLVRIPLTLGPSAPGKVLVDGVFSRLVLGAMRGLPYDSVHHQFIRSSLTGSWVFGFQPPVEIGTIRPERVRLTMDLQSPQDNIRLRRGQCRDGSPLGGTGNANGEIVGEWSNKVGLVTVQYDCTPADYDREGRIWLRMDVERSGSGGTLGVEPAWRIGQCLMDIEGQVITDNAKHE